MSTDHLTALADRLAAHARAVLAIEPLKKTAAEFGTDPADLADAVETYHAAGLAALQYNQERSWFQARVALPDWAAAEPTFATKIAPRLDRLDDGQAAWWFLRKYPHWRLRVRTNDRDGIEALLDDLVANGILDHWRPGIYEPESAAFGSDTATDIVHDLFCTDSRGVLTYARQGAPKLGRRELSLLLIRALQQHAGLDWFEAGDVFDRFTQMRPAPAEADKTRVHALAAKVRPLLTIPVRADAALFAPGGSVTFAVPWLAGFIEAGERLREAATSGRLDRGLRAILTHIVIFHWNRLGLSAATQGILARAAKAAILPRS